ncbi:Flp pilus assembly protein TadD [Rhodovulum sp. PH10]|uniref:tetratricopeptide repeat protein n=1 Tax=Rhodovulum sp. PH10 TaxID=1187851 RepID=UPI00027C1E6D|nr:tetratricopeptide repeat protein [Rhodovulum sp. PH10]EJW10956.1 Flp pilus assembly protein TadD [Rhodovulum sp. PH10]
MTPLSHPAVPSREFHCIRAQRGRPRGARLLVGVAAAVLLAATAGGCTTVGHRNSGGGLLSNWSASASSSAPRSEAEWRREADMLGQRYRNSPDDRETAVAYAKALGATGQRAQAVSVLEQTSLRHPTDKTVLGAYGRALADAGRYDQALSVLGRAHTPDRPDWRILSAQGAVLDQLGRHEEAQRYYASALKIVPGEPTVLSNLGLSYALAKDLPRAEETLRQAVARRSDDPRVRQNLALVVGLRGNFADAEAIARADLPADEAAANVAYLRAMIAKGDWKGMGQPPKIAARGQS